MVYKIPNLKKHTVFSVTTVMTEMLDNHARHNVYYSKLLSKHCNISMLLELLKYSQLWHYLFSPPRLLTGRGIMCYHKLALRLALWKQSAKNKYHSQVWQQIRSAFKNIFFNTSNRKEISSQATNILARSHAITPYQASTAMKQEPKKNSFTNSPYLPWWVCQSYKIKQIIFFVLFTTFFFPFPSYASFIEATIGTAVVNDATATNYNPAALTLLKNKQFIALGSIANFHSTFDGQITQKLTGFTQSGRSVSNTNYFLPSFYLGIPTKSRITAGFAIISNFFNSNFEDNSILRYAQSSNRIENIDFIPALGMKLNPFFSIGAGINLSYAHFIQEPTSGFPSLNIPDSQSHNDSNGTGIGGDVGFLLQPATSTLIGFNYRSAITYHLSGKSVLKNYPDLVSKNYAFDFWTPARSVLSINQFITPVFGLIGTAQYIQWNIFQNNKIRGIATQVGSQAMITNAVIPYHLHNTWLFTLGSHYRITPKWIVRIAGSYNQSPGNSHYQLTTGNSVILGASMGYTLSKNVILDGSYAHAFIQKQTIAITSGRNIINGNNNASRNACSLKLTYTV